MKIEALEYKAKNGETVIMRSGKETDGEQLRKLAWQAYGETRFLSKEQDEFTLTAEQETAWIMRMLHEPRAVLLMAELNGEIIPADISVSDRDFIEKLSSVIHNHISMGKLDYDELASAFFVGKTQLNRKIKAVTGYTTTEYILQIRVSMAKQLLVKTDFSIGEIASRVGIDDVAYFSSIFRKITGRTPTAYRNR
jgi:YesN/AraC family two-component response regulator